MAPKKGKKATKALHHAKKLEATKPLAVDTFLKLEPIKGD
jgi:hypothetical protein